MTKGSFPAIVALALLMAASGAIAHGAPEPRSIDTRLLTDTTDFGDYGGPEGLLDEGGWDLLALDVREARTASGEHGVVFRIVMQTETEEADRSVMLSFLAPDGAHNVTFTEAGGWSADAGIRLEGPTPVGDGHPIALDLWVDATAMGAGAGTTLEDIHVESLLEEERTDTMPGSWYRSGVAVPAPTVDDTTISYKLQGPAALIQPDAEALEGSNNGTVTFRLVLTNPTPLDQFLDVRAEGPADAVVQGLAAGVLLPGNGTKEIAFDVQVPNGTTRALRLVMSSNLGGWLEVPVTATNTEPMATMTFEPPVTSGGNETLDEGAPGVAVPLLLAALSLLAITRRRRA